MAWKNYCVFDVLGDPKGQPRPRAFYNKKTGRAAVYEKGTAEAWKSDIAVAARSFLPASPIEGPVRLDITFVFSRPQRLMRAKDPEGMIPHTAKPDRDNLDKAVMDALTNIGMFRDDSLVCSGLIEKFYSKKHGASGALIQIFTFKEE
jgi:Holliday junction resolvase RusA-like endonuclease